MTDTISAAGAQSRQLRSLLVVAALLATGFASAADDCSGTLVIAGGGVSSDNAALFSAFVDAMPDGKVAVVSAASSSPVGSADRFRQTMMRYGVAEEDVLAVQLAVRDDEDTPDVDESKWSDNAGKPDEIAKIRAAGAIWFTGGDQSRLTETLLTARSAPTPMLTAMQERLSDCAVVGGTSAGAAIMSDPMITGGDTMAALLQDEESGELLTMGRGLGFFAPGLVDQHVDARARLGRIALALEQLAPERRIGLGVDENTAFVYRAGDSTVSVVGAASVTFLDARDATWSRAGDRIGITGMVLSVVSPGSSLDIQDGSIRPADYLEPTIGREYNDFVPVAGGGMAVPVSGIARLLGEALLDNKASKELARYSFNVTGASDAARADGILYRFRQTPDSAGYWGYDPEGKSRYTVLGVAFDITPFSAALQPAVTEAPNNDGR